MTYRFDYDNTAKAGYLKLTDAPVARTRELRPGLMLDLDEQGEVVGVEYLESMKDPVSDFFNSPDDERRPTYERALENTQETQEGVTTRQEIQDLMPERKGKDGKMTMEFTDGRKADLKVHSDIAVGFNQALTEVEAVLPQIIALAEKRGAEESYKQAHKDFFSMDLIASFLDFVPEEHKDVAQQAYIDAVSEQVRNKYQPNHE